MDSIIQYTLLLLLLIKFKNIIYDGNNNSLQPQLPLVLSQRWSN